MMVSVRKNPILITNSEKTHTKRSTIENRNSGQKLNKLNYMIVDDCSVSVNKWTFQRNSEQTDTFQSTHTKKT